MGYKVGALEASKDGESVYRKLGFLLYYVGVRRAHKLIPYERDENVFVLWGYDDRT